ncbi:MAG TPA: AraC family transcriptional regulator ligand-binding domain-containing protein [Polyangiales bacterium]|nr:AraC family transcriptional regulator ligand-binding domain-containing protein [Polyangiales bacterium]
MARSAATNRAPKSQATRVVPSFLLRAFWDEIEKRGVPLPELERLSGVGRPQTGDCATTIPAADMHRLFEVSQALSGDRLIGLTTGRAIGPSGFHLLSHIVLASATLQQALELVTRVQPQLRKRRPRIDELANGVLRIGFLDRDRTGHPGARAEAEFTGVLMHDIALQFFANAASERPIVEFPFSAPDDPQPYRRMFPGGVRFDGEGTFVYMPRAALAERKSGADAALLEHLSSMAIEQYSAADTDDAWTQRVRSALRAQTTLRSTDARVLARQLGVSVRGLARRLAREGENLTGLLDDFIRACSRALAATGCDGRPSRGSAGVRGAELVFPRFSAMEWRAYAERISSSAHGCE